MLTPLHQQWGSEIFLNGVSELALSETSVPQLVDIDEKLESKTGFRVVPAEGLLAGNSYFQHWSHGEMPCTQFLRHSSNPAYTPEPDIVHDVLGHVPPLMNHQFCEVIRAFGRLSTECSHEEMVALIRFYWFTVEFGLIHEQGELKVLGAGLLSSIEELPRALGGSVSRQPFSLARVIDTDFNPNDLQQQYFVLESLDQLQEAVELFRGDGVAGES